MTYEPGLTNVPIPFLKGVNAVVDYLKKIIPDNVSTYILLSTKLIKFIPPFAKKGCSNYSSSVLYSTATAFGTCNLTEKLILALKFVDKEIIRIKELGFGR